MRAVAIALAVLASSPAWSAAPPEISEFDSPAAALASLWTQEPRVVGLGEYHEIKDGPKVASALARFRDQLLDELAPRASDLILETWITAGNCGKQEEKVVAQVEETTRRPETTESELVQVIKRAKARGVQPHILQFSCGEYKALLDDKSEIDFVKLLGAINSHLKKETLAALKARGRSGRAVLVYGGALHNDLYPERELRPFTYGAAIQKATSGHYLEVDLYVPEYIERDKQIPLDAWYPALATRTPGKTLLVRRGKGSYILVFPRTPAKTTVVPPG